jgi:hypothetical protein
VTKTSSIKILLVVESTSAGSSSQFPVLSKISSYWELRTGN